MEITLKDGEGRVTFDLINHFERQQAHHIAIYKGIKGRKTFSI